MSALATACEALGIDKLSDQDIQFLREFAQVFQPIADSITFLEGSRNMFGTYLPTLFSVRTKLREMHHSNKLAYCRPLLDAVRDGFQKRFDHLMSLGNVFTEPDPRAVPLFIAMVSNPRFKVNFIPPYWFDENPGALLKIQNLLLNVMKDAVAQRKQPEQQQQQQQEDEEEKEKENEKENEQNHADVNENDIQSNAPTKKCKFVCH